MNLKKPSLDKINNVLIGATCLLGSVALYQIYSNTYVHHEEEQVFAKRNVDFSNLSQANQELMEFPTELSGAESVDKLLVSNADKVLVHLRQQHLVDNISEESKKTVREVQGAMYKTLEELTNEGYTTFFNEGEANLGDFSSLTTAIVDYQRSTMDSLHSRKRIVEQQLSRTNERIENYPQSEPLLAEKTPLEDLKTKLEQHQNDYQQIQDSIDLTSETILESQSFNALERLLYNYDVRIVPAEKVRSNLLGSMEMTQELNLSPEEVYENRMTLREDVALEQIERYTNENDQNLAIIVYGAAHDWTDNIIKWNKENPQSKYSLIQITPENLDY